MGKKFVFIVKEYVKEWISVLCCNLNMFIFIVIKCYLSRYDLNIFLMKDEVMMGDELIFFDCFEGLCCDLYCEDIFIVLFFVKIMFVLDEDEFVKRVGMGGDFVVGESFDGVVRFLLRLLDWDNDEGSCMLLDKDIFFFDNDYEFKFVCIVMSVNMFCIMSDVIDVVCE